MRLIILAAGQGTRLRPLTNHHPKCLTKLQNKPLLEWQIEAARLAGIEDIVVVGGYRIEQLRDYDITVVENPLFDQTNMVYSLYCAKQYCEQPFVLSYGDIVYESAILSQLIQSPHHVTVTIDRSWLPYWQQRFTDPLSDAESLRLDDNHCLIEIGQKANNINEIQAQYIGLMAFKNQGLEQLQKTMGAQFENTATIAANKNLYMTDLLQKMITSGYSLHTLAIERGWFEIDSLHDLFIAEQALIASTFQKNLHKDCNDSPCTKERS